jgi:hypothetical protein
MFFFSLSNNDKSYLKLSMAFRVVEAIDFKTICSSLPWIRIPTGTPDSFM